MQGQKTLIALVAVVVVAAGAYYMLAGSATAPTMVNNQETGTDSDALPVATDSVDDFAGALDADLAATAAALNAFDVDVSTSLSEIDAARDSSNLYDPEQI